VPAFQHLSVLVSIVVGMSMSQVLFGLGQLLRRRGSYKIDPLYILSNVIVLLVLVDSWWAAFSWHDMAGWSYRRTWFVMLNPLLVTMAAQLLPPDWDERPVDFHKTYYKNHRLFFGLLTFYPRIDMLDSGLKGVAHFKALGAGYPITCTTMSVLCAAAAFVRSRRIQCICLVGVLLIVLSFVFEVFSWSPM
jgi:hypothetical protein